MLRWVWLALGWVTVCARTNFFAILTFASAPAIRHYIDASSENQEPQCVVFHSGDFLAEEKIQTNDRIPGTDLCLSALSVICILLQ